MLSSLPERGKRAKPPWCHHLPKGHGGVSEYAVKSVCKYPRKTILQQSFSSRYEFCRSHAWGLYSRLPQAHSLQTQLLSHHGARKQCDTESRGSGPAAFHECGCTTEEMSLLDFTSGGGEAIPLRVDTVGREGPCPQPHLETSLLILAEGHHISTSWGPQPLEQLQVSHAPWNAIIWKPLCHANRIRKS